MAAAAEAETGYSSCSRMSPENRKQCLPASPPRPPSRESLSAEPPGWFARYATGVEATAAFARRVLDGAGGGAGADAARAAGRECASCRGRRGRRDRFCAACSTALFPTRADAVGLPARAGGPPRAPSAVIEVHDGAGGGGPPSPFAKCNAYRYFSSHSRSRICICICVFVLGGRQHAVRIPVRVFCIQAPVEWRNDCQALPLPHWVRLCAVQRVVVAVAPGRAAGAAFAELGLFARAPYTGADGTEWPSAAHAFYAARFRGDAAIRAYVVQQRDAGACAAAVAEEWVAAYASASWEADKITAVLGILRERCEWHPPLRSLLLATRGHGLRYVSDDGFWGAGRGGRGANVYGLLLA